MSSFDLKHNVEDARVLTEYLTQMEDILTSVPLEESLPKEQKLTLQQYAKDVWDLRLAMAVREAFSAASKTTYDQDKIDSYFASDEFAAKFTESKKDEIRELLADILRIQQLLQDEFQEEFCFEALQKLDKDQLKSKLKFFIERWEDELSIEKWQNFGDSLTYDVLVRGDKPELSTIINFRSQVLYALHTAAQELEHFDRSLDATATAQNNGSYVFMAAGVFVGTFCGVLAMPYFMIVSGFLNTETLKLELQQQANFAELVENPALVLVVEIWLITAFFIGAAMGVISAAEYGKHVGKRVQDPEYKAKSDLLYSIQQLKTYIRFGSVASNIFERIGEMFNTRYMYFHKLSEARNTHAKHADAKYPDLDILKQREPTLVVELKQQFKASLRELGRAIGIAKNNSNSSEVKQLYQQLESLEMDWKDMETALKKGDIELFCVCALAYLERAKKGFKEPEATGYDFSKERKTYTPSEVLKSVARPGRDERMALAVDSMIERVTNLRASLK